MVENVENMTGEQMIKAAERLLRQARDLLVSGGAPRAANRVRDAIKSVGGAVRHSQGRAYQARERARAAKLAGMEG